MENWPGLEAMPTLLARNTLNAIWPLLHSARRRPLTAPEKDELRRLCDLLLSGIPANDQYNCGSEELCLAIHSSSLLSSGSTAAIDRLMEQADELRRLIA